MILPLLLSLAISHRVQQVPLDEVGQDPPRMRSILPNGSTLLVEPAVASKTLIVHLFAASRGVDETKTTGLRHLLEHLCVKGADGHLDDRLEAQGAFLKAETLRDAMDVEIQVPPDKLDLAFDALHEVLNTKGWDSAAMAREAGIIQQEIDLREDNAILTAATWTLAYGGNGGDPLGDMATIKAATPDSLEAVRKATFATSNLTLVIEGPIALRIGVTRGTAFLTKLPKTTADAAAEREAKDGPDKAEAEAFGEVRGVAVPPATSNVCVAAICAALAIASEVPDSFVTYTPSSLAGMVVVGQTADVGKLGKFIDGLSESDADGLYTRGRSLGRRWASRQVASPEASAFTRGLLISRDTTVRFEMVQAAIEHMSLIDFRGAVAKFRSSQAFTAVGAS